MFPLSWNMQMECRAVIDVGTNSVKLLVAELEANSIRPVLETSEQTRLGKGLHRTRHMEPRAIAETVEAIAKFQAMAFENKAASIRVIATCAAREAINNQELLRAIHDKTGLSTAIISGQQEAEWAFQGVATDPKFKGKPLLILDVGGGSTEVIFGEGAHHTFRHSFPVGNLRLMEELAPADPPSIDDLTRCRTWLDDFTTRHMDKLPTIIFQKTSGAQPLFIGTGGTATMLARMELCSNEFNREAIEAVRLTRNQLLDWVVRLWSLPLVERKKIPGLPPKRADVILLGVAVYEAMMKHFELEVLHVSTRGLRFGALMGEDMGR